MKKISVLICFFLLVFSCQHGSLFRGGVINSKEKYEGDSFKDFSHKKRIEIYNKYAALEEKSTAQIVRGEKQFKIDLNKEADVAKIKNGDKIVLEKGRYSTFPNFKGKTLIIEGVSQNETMIGQLSGPKYTYYPNKTMIEGENLLFSKLSLNWAWFTNSSYDPNTPSIYTLIQVHVNVWHSGGPYPPKFRLYFTNVINPEASGVNHMASRAHYSYLMNIRSLGSFGFVEEDFFFLGQLDHSSPSFNNSVSDKITSPLDKVAMDNWKKDKFLTVNNELLLAVKENLANWQGALLAKRDDSVVQQYFYRVTTPNKATFRYIEDTYDLSALESKADNGTDNLLQKAKVAFENGYYLTASLIQSIAYKREALGRRGDAIEKVLKKYQDKAGSLYGCQVKTENDKYNYFVREAKQIYPILGMDSPRSKCKLRYVVNIDNETLTRSTQSVSTAPEFRETRESMRQRFALENARKEASKKTWEAKAKLANDKLSQAGSIFARSKATYHKIGNSNYMVYGKGTYSPKEDPFLKFSVRQAEGKLKKLNAERLDPKMEQYDTIKTVTYNAVTELIYQGTLKASFPKHKNVIINGGLESMYASKKCMKKTDSLGRRVTKYGDYNICHHEKREMSGYKKGYLKKNILAEAAQPLYEFYFSDVIKNIEKFEKSTKKEDQFEGELLKLALNYNVGKDSVPLQTQSKEIVGQTMSADQMRVEITYN